VVSDLPQRQNLAVALRPEETLNRLTDVHRGMDVLIARKLLLAERSRNPGWAEYMGEKGECLMHVAINDYTGQRRVLLRTTIAGSRPAAAGG